MDIRFSSRSNNNTLHVIKWKTDTFRNSFIIQGSMLWNDLQENLKNVNNIQNFKKIYRQILLNKQKQESEY